MFLTPCFFSTFPLPLFSLMLLCLSLSTHFHLKNPPLHRVLILLKSFLPPFPPPPQFSPSFRFSFPLPFPSFPPRLFPLHHLFLFPISFLLCLPRLPSSSPIPRPLLLPFPPTPSSLSPHPFPPPLPLPFPFLHPRVPHEWRHEGSGCHFFGLLRRRRRE